jgi:hypothetical protein
MRSKKQRKLVRVRGSLANILKAHKNEAYSTEEAIEAIIELVYDIVDSGQGLFKMVKSLISLIKGLFK